MQRRGRDFKAVDDRAALAQLVENALWRDVWRQDQFCGISVGHRVNDSGYDRKLSVDIHHQRFLAEFCPDFLHPVVVFIVDSKGTIVRYLHGTHFLAKDITLALVEASEGRLGKTIQKVVRFCFSYEAENKTYVFNLLRVSGTVVLLTAAAFLAFLFFGGKKSKKEN